jgi:hypothetical protein
MDRTECDPTSTRTGLASKIESWRPAASAAQGTESRGELFIQSNDAFWAFASREQSQLASA